MSSNGSDEFESNLQPIDMSVFKDTGVQPAVPVITPEDLASSTGESAPLSDRIDMASIAAMGTSEFMASLAGKAAKPAELDDPFAPKPESAFQDLDEEEAPEIEPEPELEVEAEEEPEAEEEAELETEPEPEPEAALDFAAEDLDPGATAMAPLFDPELEEEDDPADAEAEAEALAEASALFEPVATASAASQYSRANATYEHRSGWSAMSTAKKRAIVIVVILAMILGVAGGAALALWKNVKDAASLDNSIVELLTPVEDKIDPYWMLVLGSDSRAEGVDRARSDVIMLCRIDPQTPQVTLVSIPRDTKVYIEGYGTQKINAAYALGGAELAIKVVSEYAGVPISHYAEIYFTGLEDLVDQLGGVTVNVPEYCSYKDVTLYPGEQTLNGHQALIFARCRKTYTMGDFTRTQCQRILLEAMVEKVLSQPATSFSTILEGATQCFSTDIPLEDLITLATKMQGMTGECFYSAMCPSTSGMVDGVSYTFTYINQWKLLMQRANNGENPKLTKKEQEICGWEATDYYELDMTQPIPDDVQAELQAYWDRRAARQAAKAQKELEAQGEASASSN